MISKIMEIIVVNDGDYYWFVRYLVMGIVSRSINQMNRNNLKTENIFYILFNLV